jgi:hypothetical protein
MHKTSLSTAIACLKSAKALRVDTDIIPHFFPHDFDDVFMFVTPPDDLYGLGFKESRNRQVVIRSTDPLTFTLIGDDDKEHSIMPLTTMSL